MNLCVMVGIEQEKDPPRYRGWALMKDSSWQYEESWRMGDIPEN